MSSRRLWLVTFVVVAVAGQLAVGMRASRTASITGDEPFYLLTTQSLVSDGDLDLRDEYANREMDRFWDGTVPLWKQMEPAPDGRLLSPHNPGLSVLAVPPYWVAGLGGVQRTLVLLWAAAMAFAAVLARRLGAPPLAAGLAAVAVGAGAPGIVYASQVYPEGPAALCVALALLAATEPDRGRPRAWLLVPALVALAWLGVKYVPVAVVVAAVWAWRFRGRWPVVAAAGGLAAVAGAHFAWWHLETFGALTPYSTNVVWAGEGTAAILDHHLRLSDRAYRLYGLFLDARFGLLRWLPITALALWGLRRRSALAAAVVGVAVLMAAFASITMMGWWFPGRLLVAALPALVVLVGLGAQRLPQAALVLAGWSLAIGVAVAVAAHTGAVRLAVDPFSLGFPLPPAWLFPDFRSLGIREVAVSLAWGAGLSMALWRSSCSSTATPWPTGPSSPSPPTWRLLRAR